MKNNRKYLLAALLLLVAALLYFLKGYVAKHEHEFVDTVMAEDEAIMASADATAAVIASLDAQKAQASSDVSTIRSGDVSGAASSVLFEADPNRPKDAPTQNRVLVGLRNIKAEPGAEFEKLKQFVTKPMESLVGETMADGTQVINIGNNLEEAANITQYYMNGEKDVKFYLHFDFDTGEMTARSCANIKNEVFQHNQMNSFDMRYDGNDYVTLMANDKYYLRLKYKSSDMSYVGLLFKNGPNGWMEVQEMELLPRKLEGSIKFDPRSCPLNN